MKRDKIYISGPVSSIGLDEARLHLRKLSDFERSIFENISVGIPENGKFYDGIMSQLQKLEESNE